MRPVAEQEKKHTRMTQLEFKQWFKENVELFANKLEVFQLFIYRYVQTN